MRCLLLLVSILTLALPCAAQDDPSRGDMRILVISDLNSSYGSTSYEWQVDSTIARIPRLWKPDLVLTGGDMIAGQSSSLTDENVRAMWAAFDQHIAEPLRQMGVPLGFTIGNHDASALPGYARDRNLAAEYWLDPNHHPGVDFVDSTAFPFQYTFTQGDIFFLSWDASSATVQNLDWVEEALASDEAASARMRIAVGHLPLYAVAEGRNLGGEVLNQPEALRALLEEHDVHTYVSGHHHAYYPARRGSLQLLHAGALGSGERPLIGRTEASPNTVTIVDVDLDEEITRYTTLDATTLDTIDIATLPKAIHGVNGFVVRRDLGLEAEYSGILSPLHVSDDVVSSASGSVSATPVEGVLQITGSFEGLSSDLVEGAAQAALHTGINGRPGTRIADLTVTSSDGRSGTLSGELALEINETDLLIAGSYYVSIFTDGYPNGELRAQLLAASNQGPDPASLTSPDDGELVIVTGNLGQPLFKASWSTAADPDGDPITYAYQLAADPDFSDVWLARGMGPFTTFSISRRDLHGLLAANGVDEGKTITLYHRIITSDGSLDTHGEARVIEMSNGEPTSAESEQIRTGFLLHSVYPNPSRGEIRLVVQQDSRAEVSATVHNMLGQVVLQSDFGWQPAARSELRLDVSELSAGVYILQLESSGLSGSHSAARKITVF